MGSPEGFSPLAGGLGALPPVSQRAGGWGLKDVCLIVTMPVEKTSSTLNSY